MQNSIKPKETKDCKQCGEPFRPRKSFDKYCSYKCHVKAQKPQEKQKRKRIIRKVTKPIRAMSAKQEKLYRQYLAARKAFLSMPENQRCPVTMQPATEIHHKMGRVGYADDKEIPLLIDVRYFLAVSRDGHRKIEENPEWAKKMGYSVSRLAKT